MAHPVHPAIVHFPIACWTLSTFGDIASLWLGEAVWKLSGILLVIGTVMAVAAMVSGLLELKKIDAADEASRTADIHMQLILVAWTLYAISLFMRLEGLQLAAPGMAEMLLSGFGLAMLVTAGWYGGKLVYQHGVGVQKQ